MKPIPNYPNYSITEDGKVWSHIYDKWMKLNKGMVGYYPVALWHDMQHKKMIKEVFLNSCKNIE
jgi:hypothetical protein